MLHSKMGSVNDWKIEKDYLVYSNHLFKLMNYGETSRETISKG